MGRSLVVVDLPGSWRQDAIEQIRGAHEMFVVESGASHDEVFETVSQRNGGTVIVVTDEQLATWWVSVMDRLPRELARRSDVYDDRRILRYPIIVVGQISEERREELLKTHIAVVVEIEEQLRPTFFSVALLQEVATAHKPRPTGSRVAFQSRIQERPSRK